MRAVSARTTYPNTPESDLRERVLHTVTLSDGSSITVYARCPMDAIDVANAQLECIALS